MITIAYIYCSRDFDNNICDHLDRSCPGIELCTCIPSVAASWRELALAFINTVDAIKNKKNIARKPELEFYIRFFANRQIHTVLNNYLAEYKPYANLRTVLISHDSNSQSCVEIHIEKILSSTGYCRYLHEPESKELHKLYLKFIEKSLGSNLDIGIDEARKIVIGIIGCGAILIKD